MPHLDLSSSPLAPGASPVRVHYRDAGAGPPIVILHGGWGYDVYPFDRQIAVLSSAYRIVAPDRTGYGGSASLERQETDFHHRAAAETFAVIDGLGLERPVVWGHSDGAVIALLMGLSRPERLRGLIVEAAHVFRRKPASREFFETMMRDPDGLGERVTSVLAREHGDRWRELIRTNGDAWLRIANDPSAATSDLYGGRLADLQLPTLVIHGARDPRTEPGELDAVREAIGRTRGSGARERGDVEAGRRVDARFEILRDGGHSPHSERATADEVTRIADRFLSDLPDAPVPPALPGPLDPPAPPALPGPLDPPAPPVRRDRA